MYCIRKHILIDKDDTLSDLLTSWGLGDHQADATEQKRTGYFTALVFSHCCEMLLSTTILHLPLIGGNSQRFLSTVLLSLNLIEVRLGWTSEMPTSVF